MDGRTAARGIGYPLVVKPGQGATDAAACDSPATPASCSSCGYGTASGTRSRRLLLQRYVARCGCKRVARGRRPPRRGADGECPVRACVSGPSPTAAERRRSITRSRRAPSRRLSVSLRRYPAFEATSASILVLTGADARRAIEVNPRLTTAYLGVRSALRGTAAGPETSRPSSSTPVPACSKTSAGAAKCPLHGLWAEG